MLASHTLALSCTYQSSSSLPHITLSSNFLFFIISNFSFLSCNATRTMRLVIRKYRLWWMRSPCGLRIGTLSETYRRQIPKLAVVSQVGWLLITRRATRRNWTLDGLGRCFRTESIRISSIVGMFARKPISVLALEAERFAEMVLRSV